MFKSVNGLLRRVIGEIKFSINPNLSRRFTQRPIVKEKLISKKAVSLGLTGSAISFGSGYALYSRQLGTALAMEKNEIISDARESLLIAVKNNDLKKVKQYIDDENIDFWDNQYEALNVAVKLHYNDIAREIIISKKVNRYYLETELCLTALENGNIDIADLIIGNPNTRPKNSDYPKLVVAAARSNQIRVFQYAIDVLFVDPANQLEPLSIAASNGNLELVEFILSYGEPSTYFNAVSRAIDSNQPKVFDFLTQRVKKEEINTLKFPLNLIFTNIVLNNRHEMLKLFYQLEGSGSFGKEYCNLIFSYKELPLEVFKRLVELDKVDAKVGLQMATKTDYAKLETLLTFDFIQAKDLQSAIGECVWAVSSSSSNTTALMSYSKLLASEKLKNMEVSLIDKHLFKDLDTHTRGVVEDNLKEAQKLHHLNDQFMNYLNEILEIVQSVPQQDNSRLSKMSP